MTIQDLKNNRNEIIEIIETNNTLQIDVKVVMSKVAEYAQMGCYPEYDSEEMEQIIIDSIEELNTTESANISKTTQQMTENAFKNQRGSSMRN